MGTSPTNPPRDSITFNDQSQSLIQAGTVFQTQWDWASDVPTGTVLLGQSAQITSNSLDNRSFVSNLGKDHAQYDATGGGQIRVTDQIMSNLAQDLVTTTGSSETSINFAGQSQIIADGKLDVAETGQTGDYQLEERTRYRIQDTESIQSLWSNDAWTETGHNFMVDHEAHDAWVYNQTVNLPKYSDPIITNNPDGTTTSSMVQLGQDQSTVTSGGGYDYHLTQSGSPKDFLFALGHPSQSQSGKNDSGTWQAADGTSGATYDNLGSETKNSLANLSGKVQNSSVYYTGIDVYQTKNTSTNNTGSRFALGSNTNSHTVGSTQTIETRGGNSGSWYGSKLESGNSTTNYTTVSGTMGQPFSGMTQSGFNTMTLYGTAAQTGISGSYGSYGQPGTGGSFNSLQTGGTVSLGPVVLPPIVRLPNYPTAGGFPPNQSGVEPGFLTPISFFHEDPELESDQASPINNTQQNKIKESNLYFYKIGNQKYYPCIYCHGRDGNGRLPLLSLNQSFVNGIHYNTGGVDAARNFFAGGTSSIATAPFELTNFAIIVLRLPFSSRDDFDTSSCFNTELWRENIHNYIAPDRDINSWTTASGQIGGELVLSVFPAGKVVKIDSLQVLKSKPVNRLISRSSLVSKAVQENSKAVDPFIQVLSDWAKSPLNPDNISKIGANVAQLERLKLRYAADEILNAPRWLRSKDGSGPSCGKFFKP